MCAVVPVDKCHSELHPQYAGSQQCHSLWPSSHLQSQRRRLDYHFCYYYLFFLINDINVIFNVNISIFIHIVIINTKRL